MKGQGPQLPISGGFRSQGQVNGLAFYVVNCGQARVSRQYLFALQNGICAYCGIQMTLESDHDHSVTRDHVFPRSRGGPTALFNLVGACRHCNRSKGSSLLHDFLCFHSKKGYAVNWRPHRFYRSLH